jgi:hypothetical protein
VTRVRQVRRMEINLIGIALMADDPAASAQWFVDH